VPHSAAEVARKHSASDRQVASSCGFLAASLDYSPYVAQCRSIPGVSSNRSAQSRRGWRREESAKGGGLSIQSSAGREIRPLIHQQRAAANAHDTDGFLTTYLHAATLVFVIDGRMIRGFDNLRSQQLKWWNDGKSDVIYTELAPPEFLSLGDN
jgi:hypothetical protein